MHWSEEIAQRIIDRDPNKEEYVCAAGISPSGSVHIGNFRDVATPWFVVKALRKKGKKVKALANNTSSLKSESKKKQFILFGICSFLALGICMATLVVTD